MEIKVSTVIKMQSGIVECVRAFTSEDEAIAVFKEFVHEANNGHDNITDEIMQHYIDTGDYELDNGINIVLAHSEGDNWADGKDGTAEGLTKHIIRNYNDDTPVAYAIWQDEDVRLRAIELGEELTEEEIVKVLQYVQSNHDCCYGISWDTIDDAIFSVVYKRN